jgi:heme-degrading monooxygenase HmoA
MVIVVFRSRMRPDADMAEVEQMGLRMYELASAMPGFISYKDFVSTDGENLSLVEFESHEHLLAWRDHAEHIQAQLRAREAVFESYHITVCDPTRAYRFSVDEGRIVLL